MKDLEKVSLEEQTKFLKSFDHVLCDMDGVIWLSSVPIPGASSCISDLKKIGKNIVFVTNSAFDTIDKLKAKLSANNFGKDEALATPTSAMLSHLKNIDFKQQIYIIGTSGFKEEFQKVGYSVVPDPPQTIGESFQNMFEYIQDDVNVGAVIMVFDFNLTATKIQKALTYLKRDDCIFIHGGNDKGIPVSGNFGPIMSSHYILKGMKELSGRDAIQLAKPSIDFAKYVMKQFNIEDSNRVLFIGDSVHSDMGFATRAKFKTLLVLSGLTKKQEVLDWKFEENYKPNYYIEDLNTLDKILQNVYNNFNKI